MMHGLMSETMDQLAEGPGEGSDGSMEPGTCQELLHRLRELEAENSALAQANENQRETYERCLDEVANHVVQALLNQKDLREECIKLKKRVFDLERQNQMLSALFQQRLQLTTGSLPQIPLTPLQPPSEPPTSSSMSSAEGPATSLPLGHCFGQREVCWEQQLRPGGPGPPAALPPALDALSPFLRKKAQILEVLRALEETDPLLLCSPVTPWQPPGQGPGSPEPINGELCGPPQPERSPWAPYLLLGPGGLGGLLHWERLLGGLGGEEGTGQSWVPSRVPPQAQGTSSGPPCAPGSSSSSSSDEAGDPNEAPSPDTLLGALAHKQLNLGQLLEDTESYLQAFLAGAAGPLNGDHPGPRQSSSPDQGPPQLTKSKGLPKSAWGRGTPESQRLGFGATSEDQGPLPFLSMFMGTGDAPLGSQPGHPHSSQVKNKLQIGPPSPGEAQGPLLPSPARGLKFLKLPPTSEKVPSPGGPQLSPQLPRNSRIPCRNSGSDGSPSPLLGRRGLGGGELSPDGAQGLPTSPSPCSTIPESAQLKPPLPALSTTLSSGPVVSPCYENILDLSRSTFTSPSPEPPPSPLQVPTYSQLTLEVPQAPEVLRSPGVPPSPCLPESYPYGSLQEKSLDKTGLESPHPGRRTPGNSSKKPGQGSGRRPGDPGNTPLRDRLAALGKLKTGPEGPLGSEKNGVPAKPGTEKARAPGRSGENAGDTVSPRPPEQPETKGALRGVVALGTNSLKQQEPGLSGDPGARVYSSHSMGARVDLEPISPRSCLTKVELAKSRLAGALCPQVPRTPAKVPTSAPSLGKHNKSPHSSPTKLPSKSPTKVVSRPGAPPVTKEHSKPDKGKGPLWADCGGTTAQPTPPLPGPADPSQGPEGLAPHSAIEEKVMKGIEENVLRLQGQERAPGTEAKHRNASSIASWFGLKKSKLPALNRRTEATKNKEGAGGGSPLRREVKMEARKLEAESLNISKLMAKAEDLRRALEEEKAYLSNRARPRPGAPAAGPSMGLGQVQGQLGSVYQGADTFMQQLLNRVDGKELPSKSWREPKPEYGDFQPVSTDPKSSWPACGPRNGLVGPLQGCGKPPGKPSIEPGRREEMPSEDSLAEPVPASHFTACGSLTRTLDSGIGTFPPPDHGSSGTPSKNPPKTKPPRLEPPPGVPPAQPPPLTKVPRRAHTLEREVPGIEELLVSGRHPSMPAFPALLTATPGHRGHQTCTDDSCEDPGPTHPVQLAKNWTFPNTRAAGSSADPFLCPPRQLEGLPKTPLALPMDQKRSQEPNRPSPIPQGPAFGGSRTPSTSDMGEEGRVASGGPPGLETSESLSDSLYDSLSSCGSQG
ncbi:nck-associated protein 5-like isoform X2 [Nycticebus coucang]|uniref:nck-associated protein 5-like isoform X2 n=1 Tax=Nycticebus coucang TaxID=9470 RepID=UPI00234D385A|nr:nck-associated protein 5-like isoform X2 [Nycticebus coucang]XP_053411363.1 nck-associated protein 5-like isoform X2 [Nycticebus coucang]XP_053411364.1 nck-associated protein 5-like isoform X2 [Nycticebus coucang]XP_053411365.1 nck-associated protein 5-like isoform X2 [Nycticebus coucang]XP_053411366.1 nck-associated protein 5-like isoform X2 [Nycticebus coucang]XP_053411367.1 nck-associated protein 5-like isoform X2 [Nycticebus coucang]